MSIWTYKNVSTRSGITDGEPMFEFNFEESAKELGRNDAQRAAVLSDLQLLYGHVFDAHDVDTVFLTLQEFQTLTMKHGDFFDAAAVLFRRSAVVHFSGISGGVGRFDSQNAVRVSNMQHTRDGSRLAVQKQGAHETTTLYFGKSMVSSARAATPLYRQICLGDHLMLGHKTFPVATGPAARRPAEFVAQQDLSILTEMRNPNPAVQFVTDDKNHTLTLTPGTSGFYYLFTATSDLAAALVSKASDKFFILGHIGAVHKVNPLTPRVEPNLYHFIRIPSIQRSLFTVVLPDKVVQGTRPAAPTLTIGAPVPESVTVQVPIAAAATPTLKRTPADAGLPVAAAATPAAAKTADTSAKRARAAVGASAAASNPMS